MNTAQYTPNGKSDTYIEDWKPYVIVSKLISDIPNAEKIVLNNRTGEKYTKKSYLDWNIPYIETRVYIDKVLKSKKYYENAK